MSYPLRRWMRSLIVLSLLLTVAASVRAEEPSAPPIDPRLSADDDAYMTRQAAALLAEVDGALARVPPQVPEPAERRLALRLLDAVLHDPYAPKRPPLHAFYHRRIEQAVGDIESRTVDDGAVVWRLYNHGFVVRTATVTLGFDIHRGAAGFRQTGPGGERTVVETPEFPVSSALVDRLAEKCDVLFISHRHGDHTDPVVVQAFLDRNKPVVAPPDVLENNPLHERITHLERKAHDIQHLPIQEGARQLDVVVYPGQQYQGSGIPNNVVLVFTPEGLSFAHNGDQINDPYPAYQEDFQWIDAVKDHHKVDVFMTNCWTNDLLRMVKGFDPRLVIPGHENELGHPLWDRVPYWGDEQYLGLNYSAVKEAYPVVPMAWGESFAYKR